MLKRDITYEDFNGNTTTETFYFNISKPELVELEVEVDGGMTEWIQNIIKSENHREIVAHFKKIVLLAYGKKSPDGKHFIKDDEDKKLFSYSAAYQTLFMELATDAEAAADFLIGAFPKDMQGEVQKALANQASAESPAEVSS